MNGLLRVRHWPVWELPRPALAAVATTHALFAMVAAEHWLRRSTLTAEQWSFAGVVGGALILAYVVECREGTIGQKNESYSSQQDAWILAAILICPGWIAMLLPAAAYLVHYVLYAAGMRPQDGRSMAPHKMAFNCSSWGLAAGLGALTLTAVTGLGIDPLVLALLGPAAAALTIVLSVHVAVGMIVFAVVGMPFWAMVREQGRDLGLSVQNAGLGALAALAWLTSPLAILFVLPLFGAMQRSLLHKQLLERARTDGKTGLINAEFWRQSAEAEIGRAVAGENNVSVLVVDLDHFKRVNDTHGHLVGDDVLREVAARLRAEVRPGDLVGRFGGEEFVVLLPGAGSSIAVEIGERLRSAVANSAVVSTETPGLQLEIRCSIGAASVACGTGTALSDVLAAADEALYQAKRSGRDQVVAASANPETQRGSRAAGPGPVPQQERQT